MPRGLHPALAVIFADTFVRSAPLLPLRQGATGTVVRRRFDHLVMELSVAVGCVLPRYALWLRMRESGINPEALSREEALAFCDAPVTAFLGERGLALPIRARRRLLRAIERFDPSVLSPYERFARI